MDALHRAFIGLGANLGDPAQQIRSALDALRASPDISNVRASSLYRSAPVDGPGQSEYVNAVAMMDTVLEPVALLRRLLDIEIRFGRQRSVQNAPRTLDLDLLLYDQETIDIPDLRIPHPRMHQRRFVLEPLVEIAPALEIPGHGSAARLLAGVSDQAVQRLEAVNWRGVQ
jgi:2-amino-4-hydroxy-6-hydroxymethyldihydropteridine diphosphokinase